MSGGYYSPPHSAAASQDPAFEPHSTFMFDEPSNRDDIRNIQRNIDSINTMGHVGDDSAFDPMDGTMDTSDFQHDFDNPFLFDQTDMSADSTMWQNGQTLPDNIQAVPTTQEDILRGRGGSISQRYGQITPPDDDAPTSYGRPPPPTATAQPPSSNAKSERARNAANQRHAKAKKARRDSVRKADTPEGDEEDEVDDKREKYREKNRVAAAKCRAKKKVNTDDLELSAREATARNNQLRAEERHLRDMFSSLRDQALAHDPTQGCNCSAIHAYNMHQAQRAVRGANMGFQGGAMLSPSQRSGDSPSTTASVQAESFAGIVQQCPKHPVRVQSFSDHMDPQLSARSDSGQSKYAFAARAFDQPRPSGTAAEADDLSEYV